VSLLVESQSLSENESQRSKTANKLATAHSAEAHYLFPRVPSKTSDTLHYGPNGVAHITIQFKSFALRGAKMRHSPVDG
jgi:hypothetical protein